MRRGDDCLLPYNVLGREESRDIMYIRRTTKCGRKRGKDFSLFIGRFRSGDDAICARVVRWNHGMDVDDKARLIPFLIRLNPSKKLDISEVSLAEESWQPLVEI